MKALLAGFVALSALAQTAVNLPRVGAFCDGRGQVRLVYGVRANFVVTKPVAAGVRAWAAGEKLVAVKTAEALIALDRDGNELSRLESGDGPAIVSVQGDAAAAYLVDEQKLAVYRKGQWSVGDVSAEGTPTAILWKDGEPQLSVEAVIAPLSVRDGAAWAGDRQLSIAGVVTGVESMGGAWYHVSTQDTHYAVELRPDQDPAIYELPGGE